MAKPKKKENKVVKSFKVKMGRPRLYSCAEMLDNHIDEYVQHCMDNERSITMVGFANFAGMDKTTLSDWGANKTHDFSPSVKRLKQFAEEYATEVVLHGKNAIGGMFVLKTNHGYIETSKTITEHKMFDPNEQASESVDNLLKSLKNDKQDQKTIDITLEVKEDE